MQYDARTPDEYLAMQEDDWRKERLLLIRDAFFAIPGIEEGIGHGMLRYSRNGDVFAHLNTQKGYVGVYLGVLDKLDPGGKIRGGMSCGKTCLRVRKRDGADVAARLIALKAARPDLEAC